MLGLSLSPPVEVSDGWIICLLQATAARMPGGHWNSLLCVSNQQICSGKCPLRGTFRKDLAHFITQDLTMLLIDFLHIITILFAIILELYLVVFFFTHNDNYTAKETHLGASHPNSVPVFMLPAGLKNDDTVITCQVCPCGDVCCVSVKVIRCRPPSVTFVMAQHKTAQ